jgi:hypothetical protein
MLQLLAPRTGAVGVEESAVVPFLLSIRATNATVALRVGGCAQSMQLDPALSGLTAEPDDIRDGTKGGIDLGGLGERGPCLAAVTAVDEGPSSGL